MTSRQVYFISSIMVCLLVGPVSGLGAADPSVTLINKQGETLRGNLTRIRNNHVRLKSSAFEIRMSLNAIKAIHFNEDKRSPRNRTAPYLITSDGRVIEFRRLIKTTDDGLLLQLEDRQRLIPYKSIQSVFFSGIEANHQLIYESTTGNTRSITIDMNNDPVVTSGTTGWITYQRGNKFSCHPVNNAGDTGSASMVELWDLPPSPGTQWPITRGNQRIGAGVWKQKQPHSNARYPFHLRFSLNNASESTVNVTGNFDPTSLIPTSLVVNRTNNNKWTLTGDPPRRTLTPCVVMLFTTKGN